VSAKGGPKYFSQAPVADSGLAQLADVLVDCVEAAPASASMSPFSHQKRWHSFAKSPARLPRPTPCCWRRADGRIVGTVQLGLDTPPNQPHRADIKKLLVHRSFSATALAPP